LDPLHAELLEYERTRSQLGDAAVESESGPVLDWPAGWGSWSLAEHRRIIATHFTELAAILREERR